MFHFAKVNNVWQRTKDGAVFGRKLKIKGSDNIANYKEVRASSVATKPKETQPEPTPSEPSPATEVSAEPTAPPITPTPQETPTTQSTLETAEPTEPTGKSNKKQAKTPENITEVQNNVRNS